MADKKESFYNILGEGESNPSPRRSCLSSGDSKKHYFDLYNLAPVGYLTLSKEGLILEANRRASTLLGLNLQAIVGVSLSNFIHQEDLDIYHRCKKSSLNKARQSSCELRMLYGDGVSFWVQLDGNVKESGGIRVYRFTITSIAKRKKLQEQERIAAIAFKSQNGMTITDKNGVIEKVNPTFTAITGYSEEESIGQTMRILKSERHGPLFYQRMWESIKKTQRWQ
ncbi:MAG: PAS domain S-box protein, partial [Helicobacteraceae bacterium]|nr:PAS domain S-box protein [Candidatus Sulfurimonas ponti]